MAIAFTLSEEDQKENDEWTKTRPKIIQDLIKKLPHNILYRLKSSGHRVLIYSYLENNTVTAMVLGKYNLVQFERRVFGIPPNDLEECDLPEEGERLGIIQWNDLSN